MAAKNQNLVEMILNKKMCDILLAYTGPADDFDRMASSSSSLNPKKSTDHVAIRNRKGEEIGQTTDIRLLSHAERQKLLRGPTIAIIIGSNPVETVPAAIINTASLTSRSSSDIHLPPDTGKEEVKYLISYLKNICIVSEPFPLVVRKNLPKDLAVVRVAWQLGMPLYVQHLSDFYWNNIKTCVPTDADIRAVETLDYNGTFTKDKRWFFHMALRLARLRCNKNSTWNRRKQAFEKTAMLSAVDSAYKWLQEQKQQKVNQTIPQKRESLRMGRRANACKGATGPGSTWTTRIT
jgi:hypothetical protein